MDEHIAKIQKWIKPSIGAGEIIKIVYMGGSHPGAEREIVPLVFSKDGLSLFAFDLADSTKKVRKQFKLEKIVVPGTLTKMQQVIAFAASSGCSSVADIYGLLKQNIDIVKFSVDVDDGFVGLYEKFKNGNTKKRPSIALMYEEEVVDYVDAITLEPVYKKAVKPWCVHGKGINSHSFQNFSNAAVYFVTECMNKMAAS